MDAGVIVDRTHPATKDIKGAKQLRYYSFDIPIGYEIYWCNVFTTWFDYEGVDEVNNDFASWGWIGPIGFCSGYDTLDACLKALKEEVE